MGQFSWFTQDTNKRIVNGRNMRVCMTDNKGNVYVEHCYEGYGEFGGKDYYELLAEMNGHTLAEFNGDHDALRSEGINLAFRGNVQGENKDVIHPSITENGKYYGGVPPKSDPNQGFWYY